MDKKIRCIYMLVLEQNLDLKNLYRRYKSENKKYGDTVYLRSVNDSIRKFDGKTGTVFFHDIVNFVHDYIGFG